MRELYRPELEALLGRYFPHVRLFGQKLLFQSAVWDLAADNGMAAAATMASDGGITDQLGYAPLYFLAACSRGSLPAALPGLHLFGDREESVYAHYNHEIRKNMAAGGRIAELEAEVASLRDALAAKGVG